MAVALVAMLGFTACDKDCDHDFIEHDFTKELVGTWTSFDGELAEAMIIKEDGSFTTTGVAKGGSLYEEKGTIKVVNNKVTLVFDGDKETFEGRLELVAGKSMSLVMFDDNDVRLTYDYCTNDLSDEILGMWVCTQLPIGKEGDMLIHTFQEDGKLILTGRIPETDDYVVAGESNYMVFGDLYISYGKEEEKALIFKFNVAPNASELGDMMTVTGFMPTENGIVEETSTWLRVKQHLELPGMKYDYIKTFVTNVKGLDKDIEFMGTTFNFAKMDGVKLDKMLKAVLFTVEFPDANTIRYSCKYNDFDMKLDAPIAVDGNKMTVKMSEKNPALKDVDLYTFQDQDNTQMHMYMHSTGFVNFFGNMQVTIMEQMNLLDTTDAAAVKAVFDSIDDAVETINVSFVMTRVAK